MTRQEKAPDPHDSGGSAPSAAALMRVPASQTSPMTHR